MYNLANLDIGKIIIALLVVCVAGLCGYVYVLKTELKLNESDYKVLEVKYGALNELVEANKVDYENNLKNATKSKEILQKQYEVKIQNLTKWRAKNENISCEDSLDFLNNYSF